MKRLDRRQLLALIASTAGATACRRYKPVDAGYIKTAGVVLESVSGLFTLRSGETFDPPFADDQPPSAVREMRNLPAYGARVKSRHRVAVYAPWLEEPLYGKIMFFEVAKDATGPVTRSYEVVVTKERTDAATGGRIAVEYETYASKRGTQVAWMLWMSDAPF